MCIAKEGREGEGGGGGVRGVGEGGVDWKGFFKGNKNKGIHKMVDDKLFDVKGK